MKKIVTQTPAILKAIDKQSKAILEKDIKKIDDKGFRNAAFLQLITA